MTANIAEGYGRYHYLDCLRFYYIADGSLTETINHIITAHDLDYMDDQRFQELYDLGREAERAIERLHCAMSGNNSKVRQHYGTRLVAEEGVTYDVTSSDLADQLTEKPVS